MSFDFFGEGEIGIKFTAEQQKFFESKLGFLDPNNKKSIQLGQAISLLKFSGESPATQKKILENLKLMGKGTLDYTDMKKILRGVALAQNRMEPTSININANIKTKMPIFYDDDSEDEPHHKDAHQPPKNPPLPPTRPSQGNPNLNVNTNEANRPKETPGIKSQEKATNSLIENMKKFQDFWSTLTTEQGTKISGNEVKRMFGKSDENKKQLSKIWKLCNHAYKGYLSKGQLYVFVSLMKSKSGHVPSALTPQMKQAIQKLDGQIKKGSQKNIGNNHGAFDFSQNFERSQHVEPKVSKRSSGNKMSQSSNDFDDFANFGNPNPKPTSEHRVISHSMEYQQPEPIKAHSSEQNQKSHSISIPVPQEIHQISKQTIDSLHNNSVKQVQVLSSQILPQIEQLSQQNKQNSLILQQTNQFLNQVDQAHLYFVNKINELKVSQDDINNRLNHTCIRMRNVIMKQSELINSLVGDFEQDLEMGKERVKVLEDYSQNQENQANQKVSYINQKQSNNNINAIDHGKNNEMARNQYQQNAENYRKSVESMREMAISMASKKDSSAHQDQDDTPVQGGGVFRQKLMQQLRQQQKANHMENSAVHADQGYHWDVGNGQQLKKSNYDEDEDEQQSAQKQAIQQAQLAQQQAQLLAQQQAQAQAQLMAQQQAQLIAQQQAQLLAQQKQQQLQQQQAQQLQSMQEEQLKNLNMKRARLIQMINYLSPITQKEYPDIVQKIMAMTQDQIDAAYAGLYKKYLVKVEEEQKAAQNKGQNAAIVNMPSEDDFSSNNFKNNDQHQPSASFF